MGDDDKMRTIDELMWRLSTPEKLQVAADMVEKANADYQRLLLTLAELRAQRDAARVLVRESVGWLKASAANGTRAIARWDEEAER